MKLWSINVPPHYVLATQETFSSSVVGVGFSARNPYMCFGVSHNGECYTQYLNEEFLSPLINSRQVSLMR
jgi:hypothetical protein